MIMTTMMMMIMKTDADDDDDNDVDHDDVDDYDDDDDSCYLPVQTKFHMQPRREICINERSSSPFTIWVYGHVIAMNIFVL
jgi:hypothetical protein